MNSKTIVEKYEAKLEGQQFLWTDYDYILRKTPFKSVDPNFDHETLVHWWMYVYCPVSDLTEETVSLEIFKSWSDGIHKTFKHISCFGYRPETNQSALNFRAYKDEPTDEMVAELGLWLPHVKPADCYVDGESKHKRRQGVYIHIQEETCSERGAYSLQVFGDEYEVGRLTHGHYRVLKRFTNLQEVVSYISQHHWLGEKRHER